MADPFSTAAAAISLVSIAIQVGLKLRNTISRLNGISAELRRLQHDLDTSMEIVSEIQRFCNSHQKSGYSDGMYVLFETIENRLKSFVQDVMQLQLIIGKQSDKNEARKNRFGMMVKSVLNEQKIMELSSRITMHKATLGLALMTASGHDGQAMNSKLSHIVKGINCLHEGHTTLQAQVTESSARTDGNFSIIRTRIDTLELLVRHMYQPQPYTAGRSETRTIIRHGSSKNGVTSLEILCPQVRQLLLPAGLGFDGPFPREDALWFRSQLHALLSDILEDESHESISLPSDLCSINSPEQSQRAGHVSENERSISSRHAHPKSPVRVSPIETILVEADFSYGNICTILKTEFLDGEGPSQKDRRIIGRTVFIPRHESPLSGIIAEFTRCFRRGNEIPRMLSTFGIHLDESPIFEYLKAGDTNMICKLLSARQITPNDRDQRGNSLLWYAISDSYNYQVCRVLLEEGAEVSDCNKYGDHALAVLLRKLPASAFDNAKVCEEALSLIRLLIRRCRGEASSMCLYKRRQTTVHAEAGPFHCLLSRLNCNIGILELVKLILENGFDLEARDVNGNTPLLYSMYYTPEFQLVGMISVLLKAGANVCAMNNFGEGCLHLLLRRLSACNNYKMSHESMTSIIDILVMLLDRGCDPTLGNVVGYTPLDAALSPTAWPILCSALEKSGMNIMDAILAIDDQSGIVLFDAEVEEKLAEALGRFNLTESWVPEEEYKRLQINGPCYLCRNRTDARERRMPFDEFQSRVVEELGFGIHMVLCKHYNGEKCLKIQEDDSCHIVDYHPDTMLSDRKRKRSWNRHVAYKLWRDGTLRTPKDSQRWAVGSKAP